MDLKLISQQIENIKNYEGDAYQTFDEVGRAIFEIEQAVKAELWHRSSMKTSISQLETQIKKRSTSMEINGMKITDVVVYPIHKKSGERSKLVAFAKVVLNDQFIIHGIRIYQGVNGPFMTFPQDYSKKNATGKGYTICHPTTAELRNHINEQVMAEFALTVDVEVLG